MLSTRSLPCMALTLYDLFSPQKEPLHHFPRSTHTNVNYVSKYIFYRNILSKLFYDKDNRRPTMGMFSVPILFGKAALLVLSIIFIFETELVSFTSHQNKNQSICEKFFCWSGTGWMGKRQFIYHHQNISRQL